jgi:hypothetical protein
MIRTARSKRRRRRGDPWLRYEAEKQALQAENLTCEEYEKRIKEITDRLGL